MPNTEHSERLFNGTFPEDGTMWNDVGSASAVIMTGEHSAHYFGVWVDSRDQRNPHHQYRATTDSRS